jgi:hypothetical protein
MDTPTDLYRSLIIVAQPRKLFLLGAVFLRRVWDALPAESMRTAVETTEKFARGRASLRDLLEAWTEAEADSHEGVFRTEEDDDGWEEPDDWLSLPVHPAVREAVQAPADFASRAIAYSGTLAQEMGLSLQETESITPERLYHEIVGDPSERPQPAPACAREQSVRYVLGALGRAKVFEPLTMLALADALEEAGCPEGDLIAHCRQDGPHVAGCWAVERLLGRAVVELILEEPKGGRLEWF